MGTIEYISSCAGLAGIAFIFTMWQPTQYESLLAPARTDVYCPDLRFMHSVGSDLKTGLDVVDACSSALNVVKY